MERGVFGEVLEAGYVDAFRKLHPEDPRYTWWSNRFGVRERNIGWRIDYFLVTENLMQDVTKAQIHTDVMGSDHCPIELVVRP